MPPGSQEASTQRNQDKESKRARGALSCAECRRLKLKCSRTSWPCESCVRRGCSEICPNGSLVTGQGTRFVLADTDRLHAKIARMSDRIRQLEDALALVYGSQSQETHPLLASRELLMIKSSLELHSAADGRSESRSESKDSEGDSQVLDTFGTLAIFDDGVATFYGRSAGSESILIGEMSKTSGQSTAPSMSNQLPLAIQQMSNVFPFTSWDYHPPVDLEYLLQNTLPPRQEAEKLCELYWSQAKFYFGPVDKRQIQDELLPSIYPKFDSDSDPAPRPAPHDLALLFIIFCFGCLMDTELPCAPDNQPAERYSILTKAALGLDPIIRRPPTVSTTQTVCLMGIYEGLCAGENSMESTWALFGLSTKLAQSVGLHRDPELWKLSPTQVQKRRAFFWELYATDCWLSLATGRLPTFSLPFVDSELPFDYNSTIDEDGAADLSFLAWKARFGRDILSGVVQGTLTSKAPKYAVILELDRSIRDFPIPRNAQGPPPQGKDFGTTMSYFMVHNYIQMALAYIHRIYFAQALSTHPNDPIKSPYAPSFLAGYRSACHYISYVTTEFNLFPTQIARLWIVWTHGFSATILLSSVVTHAPGSKVALSALHELKKAYQLFEKASVYGGRAAKFFPIIQRLLDKANRTLQTVDGGVATKDGEDEFSIFVGRTTLKNVRRPSPPEGPPAISPSTSDSESSHSSQAFPEAHPSLLHDLRGFNTEISAQVERALPLFSSPPDSHHPRQYPVTEPQRHVPAPPSSFYQYPQGTQPPPTITTYQTHHQHYSPGEFPPTSRGYPPPGFSGSNQPPAPSMYHPYHPHQSWVGPSGNLNEDPNLQSTWQRYNVNNYVVRGAPGQ